MSIKIKFKKFWEKFIAVWILWQKFGGGEANIPPEHPPHTFHPSPGIGLKWHTFNIRHYLHRSYLHKKFVFAYIGITKLVKKKLFQEVYWRTWFCRASAKAKNLRAWILHDNWLNDSPRNYCFYIFMLLKYNRIFSKNLEHDIYVVELTRHFAGS